MNEASDMAKLTTTTTTMEATLEATLGTTTCDANDTWRRGAGQKWNDLCERLHASQ